MPDDIRLVALKEMISKDNTLNEVFNLDDGYSMAREFTDGEWTRAKIEEDDNGDE